MTDEEAPARFHVHLSALVRRRDEILIMKRAVGSVTGAWYLPGGGLEPDESPEEGVLREIREETALEVQGLRLFRIWPSRQPDDTPALAFTFIADVPPGTKPTLNFEHSEHRWIAPLEYRERFFSDAIVAAVANTPGLPALVGGIRSMLDAYLAEEEIGR